MLPGDISGDPIIEARKLAPYMEGQPELTKPWCLRCVNHWGAYKLTDSGELPPNDELLARLREECQRTSVYQKCSRCNDPKNGHPCELVPANFRRAMNVLIELRTIALLPITNEEDLRCKLTRTCLYAQALRATLTGFKSCKKNDIKKAGGDEAYAHARRQSLANNLKRQEMGMQGVGLMEPMNIVVDAEAEEWVVQYIEQEYNKGEKANQKLRNVWFGLKAT